MQLTVTPCGPSSRARDFAQPVTPGRTVFDRARCSVGSFTALDVKIRMRPPAPWTRYGRLSSTRRIAGRSRSSTASATSSADMLAAVPGGGPPLFQTTMSMPPNAWTVRSTTAARSRGVVTSPRTASAPRRSASRSSTSRRRANMVTFAPSPASASAVASPSPAEAPQTIAVRPLSPRSTALRHRSRCRHQDAGTSALRPSELTGRCAWILHNPLRREDADDLAHGVGGLVQHRLLLLGELELDDLLDSSRAELDRHAHVEAVDAVLALE